MAPPFALDDILDKQTFAYHTGQVFRGLTITETPEGHNIILRAYSNTGEALYAMSTVPDALEGLRGLFDYLSSKGGESAWRRDRYYYQRRVAVG
jgi:hypothetical protein